MTINTEIKRIQGRVPTGNYIHDMIIEREAYTELEADYQALNARYDIYGGKNEQERRNNTII